MVVQTFPRPLRPCWKALLMNYLTNHIIHLMNSNPRTTEIVSAIAAIGWVVGSLIGEGLGFYLIDRESYSLVVQFLPQYWWTFLFAAVGLFQMGALFSFSLYYRQLAASLASSLWFSLSILLLMEQIYNPAAWVYLTIATANCWAFSQIPRHNKYEKE